jgi:hypothetical protein
MPDVGGINWCVRDVLGGARLPIVSMSFHRLFLNQVGRTRACLRFTDDRRINMLTPL